MTEPSTWGESSRPRLLLSICAGLIAIQLVIRGWVSFSGFFSLDDYVFYTRAGTSSLDDVTFLFTDYNGHLMPGSMVWVWLTTELAPLKFAPVVIIGLILQMAVDVAMLLVLRRLFGMRYAILVPLAIFLFTTLTLPGLVWWAAALNQLPQQLFMLLAVLAHLRFLRTERRREAILAPLAILGGLAFSEKTLLAIPLLFVVTWFFFVGAVNPSGFAATIRRYRSTWIVHGALALAYIVVYAMQVDSPVRGGLTTEQAVTTVDVAVRRTILPGIFGGPWSWKPLGTVDSLAAPHPIAQVVVVLAFGSVIAYSLALSRNAWRGWALLGLSVAAELALLLMTRVQVVGAEAVAAEYRYFTDLGLVAALAIGFAFWPVVTATRHRPPALLDAPPLFPSAQPHINAIHQPTLAILGLGAVLIGAIYSAGTYRDRWASNPGADYFANALPDLRALPESAVVYDGPVPTDVVWRLLWPATLPSHLIGPTGIAMDSLEVGQSTTQLVDINAGGNVEASKVSGIAAAEGPDACGWQIDDSATQIPLDETAFYWNWVLEVRYQATVDTTVEITAGETTTSVDLQASDDVVYLAVEGEVDTVEIRSLGAPTCVTSLIVGLPQPVEW